MIEGKDDTQPLLCMQETAEEFHERVSLMRAIYTTYLATGVIDFPSRTRSRSPKHTNRARRGADDDEKEEDDEDEDEDEEEEMMDPFDLYDSRPKLIGIARLNLNLYLPGLHEDEDYLSVINDTGTVCGRIYFKIASRIIE